MRVFENLLDFWVCHGVTKAFLLVFLGGSMTHDCYTSALDPEFALLASGLYGEPLLKGFHGFMKLFHRVVTSTLPRPRLDVLIIELQALVSVLQRYRVLHELDVTGSQVSKGLGVLRVSLHSL